MEITTAASEIGGDKANSRVRKGLHIQETVNSVPSLVGPKWCVMGSQEWVLKKRQQMPQSNHIRGGVPFLLTLNRVLFLTTALKLFLGKQDYNREHGLLRHLPVVTRCLSEGCYPGWTDGYLYKRPCPPIKLHLGVT